MKILAFLFSFFLSFINLAHASQVITLIQLSEEKVKVGESFLLQVKPPRDGYVNNHSENIKFNFILPYIYITEVEQENGVTLLRAIATNLNEKYKPFKINEEVILFNIENEDIDKTQLEIPKEYYFNLINFDLKKQEIIYYVLALILVLFFLFVFKQKIYPKMKKKRKWIEEQGNLLLLLNSAQETKDFERIYQNRKTFALMYTYNNTQFEALLSLIDRNQYQKAWKQDELLRAQNMIKNINLNKKKYSGN